MRKLLRNIARNRMETMGIKRINKEQKNLMGNNIGSYFANNWRKFAENKQD